MKPLVYERIVPAALAANRERGGRKAIERDIELTRRRIAAAGGRVPDGLAARLDGLMVCLSTAPEAAESFSLHSRRERPMLRRSRRHRAGCWEHGHHG
jgi:hypothetical protein